MSVTSAQIAANQANAQLSTGPKTEAGKAKSSLNAVSSGLTGRTVLLPSDDAEAYREHMANYFVRHDPLRPKKRNWSRISLKRSGVSCASRNSKRISGLSAPCSSPPCSMINRKKFALV